MNTENGVGAGDRRVPILVTSMGQVRYNDGTPVPRSSASVTVDGIEYNGGVFDNLNIIVLDSGRVVKQRAYAFYSGQLPNFLALMDSIQIGQRVLLWANGGSFGDSDGIYPSVALRSALKSLGSTLADSLINEDSYALIGGKGIPSSEVRESRFAVTPTRGPNFSPPYYSSVRDTIIAPAGAGYLVAPVIGPAVAWRGVKVVREGSGALGMTVYGVKRNGTRDSLLHVDNLIDSLSLGSVDVVTYPRIEIRTTFSADISLRLKSIAVDFDPSPELAVMPSTMRLQQDSVLQGDSAYVLATVVNLSRRSPAENILVRLIANDSGAAQSGVDSIVVGRILPLDSMRRSYGIATNKLRGDHGFRLQVNPNDNPSELYTQNNTISTTLRVGIDSLPPGLAIYADGNRLMSGDYVEPLPRLEVRIFDNSHLPFDRATLVQMILDNDIITLGDTGTSFVPVGDNGKYRGSFYYRPKDSLANGKHEVLLKITDASGNVDSTEFIPFNVERNLGLHNVVNWPNPFVDKTTFTFLVSGAHQPTHGEIGIFTVAGRRIKTIHLGAGGLHIGFNKVEWDGYDDDLDRLANGVYLYRITVNDGDTKQEVIERLVKIR